MSDQPQSRSTPPDPVQVGAPGHADHHNALAQWERDTQGSLQVLTGAVAQNQRDVAALKERVAALEAGP